MTANDPRDDPRYRVGGQKYKGEFEAINTAETAEAVKRFHSKSDVDSSSQAHHHTLGIKHDQASPGDHMHDGTVSKKILTGTTLTGSRGGNVALVSVIAALVKLGATDNTVA